MKIGKKEVNVEKLIFFMNLFSFIVSILFYMRMFREFDKKGEQTPVTTNTEIRDSIIKIDAALKIQINELKQQQAVLIQSIQQGQQKLITQQAAIKSVHNQIKATINSDWDKLDSKQKDSYTEQLLLNLKKSPS